MKRPSVRTPGLRVVAWLALAGSGFACQSAALKLQGARWTHTRLGYSIEIPRGAPGGTGQPGGGWVQISVEGADLAYRGPKGATMSLLSECRRGVARADLLARQLLIGLHERELIGSHPIALRGDAGWQQTFRVGTAGRAVDLRTVTIVSGPCTFDWLLVAPRGAFGPRDAPSQAERSFEQWWSSFRRAREDPARPATNSVQPAPDRVQLAAAAAPALPATNARTLATDPAHASANSAAASAAGERQ
jgi:hypothetical protein